jgi:hypothetical protein
MSVVTTPNAEYKTRKKVSSTPTFHISPAHFSDHFTLVRLIFANRGHAQAGAYGRVRWTKK